MVGYRIHPPSDPAMVVLSAEGINDALLKAGFNAGFFYNLRKAAVV